MYVPLIGPHWIVRLGLNANNIYFSIKLFIFEFFVFSTPYSLLFTLSKTNRVCGIDIGFVLSCFCLNEWQFVIDKCNQTTISCERGVWMFVQKNEKYKPWQNQIVCSIDKNRVKTARQFIYERVNMW